MGYAKYKYDSKGNITKDGHTMLPFDIAKDLNRKSYLEQHLEQQAKSIDELVEAANEFGETLHINKSEPPVPVAGKLHKLMKALAKYKGKE